MNVNFASVMRKHFVFIFIIPFFLAACSSAPGVAMPYTECDVEVLGQLIHYFLSSTPEGIEQAVRENFKPSFNESIKNATWDATLWLHDNVKDAADAKKAVYAATVEKESNKTYLVVNRKFDGLWYEARYLID
jgi:hypothetical protein